MRNYKRIGIVVLAAVLLIGAIGGVCWYRAIPRTKIKDAAQARAAFEACFDNVDTALYPYNMTTESCVTDELGKESRSMVASVAIDEMRMLTIRLAYTSGQVPTYELELVRTAVPELPYCYTDLTEYGYIFEIASQLSGNRKAVGFRSIMDKVIDRTKQGIERNGFSKLYQQNETLHRFLQNAGMVAYSITENTDGSGYEVKMSITGPLTVK